MQTTSHPLPTRNIGKKAIEAIVEVLKHADFNVVMFAGEKCVMQGEKILGWIEAPVRYQGEINSKFIRKH